MHDDAKAAGNHIITLSAIEASSVDRLLEQALAKLEHCVAIMVDCDIDLIDREPVPGRSGGRGRVCRLATI